MKNDGIIDSDGEVSIVALNDKQTDQTEDSKTTRSPLAIAATPASAKRSGTSSDNIQTQNAKTSKKSRRNDGQLSIKSFFPSPGSSGINRSLEGGTTVSSISAQTLKTRRRPPSSTFANAGDDVIIIDDGDGPGHPRLVKSEHARMSAADRTAGDDAAPDDSPGGGPAAPTKSELPPRNTAAAGVAAGRPPPLMAALCGSGGGGGGGGGILVRNLHQTALLSPTPSHLSRHAHRPSPPPVRQRG
jgi:hypothetical protein